MMKMNPMEKIKKVPKMLFLIPQNWKKNGGKLNKKFLKTEKNLLNSIYAEKENGGKQLKVVEITREIKAIKEPFIKIKYTIEDNLCLNGNVQEKN